MSSIPKKERRPSHEFLSELSVSQKHRFTNEKHHLKLKLDKLDVQRRRSLDVIENERRMISASLQKQQYDKQRFQQRETSSVDYDADIEKVQGEGRNYETGQSQGSIRTPRAEIISVSRSISVDLGKHGRRLSIATPSERIPRSAGTLRRRNLEIQDLERTRSNMTPEKILSFANRRHSDTSTLADFGNARSSGKGFSFSQALQTEELSSPKAQHTPNADTSKRRMSMPVLFPSLNTCVKSNSRPLGSPRENPRSLQRRHSLNMEQCPRRNNVKKIMDTSVAKMAGMHGVMQRTSIFQIQENDAVDEV